MDIRQSKNYAKYMQLLGWQVERALRPGFGQAGGANVFIRHLPLVSHWSVIKIQRPTSIDFEVVDKIAKRHHALFVKIEPDVNLSDLRILSDLGFQKDSWPLLPTRTLVLDLSSSLGEIFERLPKDTRYEVKQSLKRKVEVKESDDIELFYRLLQETMKIGKWSVPIKKEVISLWKAFQPEFSQILIAYQGQSPIGGCLLIWNERKAHYMYAALTRQGRAQSGAYGILFKAIEFLKKQGVREIDLEGIYDERFSSHTKNWQGFSRFKLGWGGSIMEYEGSYTKYYNPLFKVIFELFSR